MKVNYSGLEAAFQGYQEQYWRKETNDTVHEIDEWIACPYRPYGKADPDQELLKRAKAISNELLDSLRTDEVSPYIELGLRDGFTERLSDLHSKAVYSAMEQTRKAEAQEVAMDLKRFFLNDPDATDESTVSLIDEGRSCRLYHPADLDELAFRLLTELAVELSSGDAGSRRLTKMRAIAGAHTEAARWKGMTKPPQAPP